MPYLNRVMLIGVLAREPEFDNVPSGITVANLRIAVREVLKDKNGTRSERINYININVWDKLADLCRKFLKKGSMIMVDGRLKTNEWITREGEKRSRLIVHAERIEFLDRPPRQQGEGNGDQSIEGANGPPARPAFRQRSPVQSNGDESESGPPDDNNRHANGRDDSVDHDGQMPF